MRKLTLLHQWANTGSGTCPAAYVITGGGHVIQGKTRPDGSIWTPADVIDRLPPGAIGTATPDDAGDYIVTGSPIVDPDEINQLVDLADDESAVHVPKSR